MTVESVKCHEVVVDPEGNGWLGKPTTRDELEVSDWLAHHPSLVRILHVGVGNATLRERFGSRVAQALTKDGGEARNARRPRLPFGSNRRSRSIVTLPGSNGRALFIIGASVDAGLTS